MRSRLWCFGCVGLCVPGIACNSEPVCVSRMTLIGRAGLDLTLVDRFETLSADSTDRMTLDGITVPAAVLDWRPQDQIHLALSGIGFHGTRCPHHLDPDATSQAASTEHVRRLFLFDLTKSNNAMAVIAELARLRDSLSVKTVSLGGLSSPQQVSASKLQQPASPSLPSSDAEQSKAPTAKPTSDEGLDALIDQLDELDV